MQEIKRTRSGLTLIHVLAAEPLPDGSTKTRSTIRSGSVVAGDRLWFEDGRRKRHILTVRSVDHSPRWSTIVFSGSSQDLENLGTGAYLHSQVQAGVARHARAFSPRSAEEV